MNVPENFIQHGIKGFYNRFVGSSDWTADAQYITQIYGFVRITFGFLVSLTGTFFILYILDGLGFKQASIVITMMLTIQLFADFPTGVLSDHIGQRWVFGSAIFLLSTGLFLLAYATSFVQFAISAAIVGFANAQVSGALESWYDNNYQKFNVNRDPEKKEYGFTINRIFAAQKFVMGITFIIGGILATAFGRPDVFIIEAIIGVFFTIFIFVFMKDFQEQNSSEKTEANSKPSFFETLKGGIGFLLESKINILFLTGMSLFQFSVVIWANLILFPLYFGYSGADNIAGLLRSTIFFIGVLVTIVISEMTKKVNKKKMNLFFALYSLFLYGGVFLLLYYIPMKNQFSWIAIVIIITLFTFTINFIGIFGITLFQRILVDFFPSEYRNSLYSVIPTIIGIISIYFLPLTGSLIESYGLVIGVGICMIFAIIGITTLEISMHVMNRDEIVKLENKALIVVSAD